MNEKIYAVLLAGGSGSRMKTSVNKILLPVSGIPCIVRSVSAFQRFADRLFLVIRPEDETAVRNLIGKYCPSLPVSYIIGGETRQASVRNGLAAVSSVEKNDAVVLIHDGARCLVDSIIIRNVLDSVRARGSGVAAVRMSDTVRYADSILLAGKSVPRQDLWSMQTPQGFRLHSLLAAFRFAENDGFQGTDDAEVMLHAGYSVFLAEGGKYNIKLTTREDLLMAESFLNSRGSLSLKVGHGYDVHRLAENRKLILCGVQIPHTLGLLGHSDADVAVHALMDAMLGAAGLGDIGSHFPDTDTAYKDIDSMILLADVVSKLHHAGFAPSNVDITIVAQKPRIAPYIPQMKENLCRVIGLPASDVNIKATTTEHLGFEGRMEGISAQAVCLIRSVSD